MSRPWSGQFGCGEKSGQHPAHLFILPSLRLKGRVTPSRLQGANDMDTTVFTKRSTNASAAFLRTSGRALWPEEFLHRVSFQLFSW